MSASLLHAGPALASCVSGVKVCDDTSSGIAAPVWLGVAVLVLGAALVVVFLATAAVRWMRRRGAARPAGSPR